MPRRISKVVHLTSVHRPRDVRIFYKEARSLARAGYDVSILVPHDTPEVIDDVRIQAIRKPHGRLDRATVTQLALLKAAIKERADIYHFHDPELMLVGLLLRLAGKKVVYDVHEDLPRQILHKTWIAAPLRRVIATIAAAAEFVIARTVSAVVVATPVIGNRFPRSTTVLVQNFPMSEEMRVERADPSSPRCVAYYAGGIEIVRGGRTMIEAFALLDPECDARLTLAGEFWPTTLHQELSDLPGWSRVDFLGWKRREELRASIDAATVGLVLFHPLPNHMNAQPNKLFEYMAAGLPVIASDFPAWRTIVDGAQCGMLVDPCNPQAIADAISWICAHRNEARVMGQRGQSAVRDRYSWDAQAAHLLELYSRLSRA
jgi:glycosyltransferase involved in cell wall biosynthesis